MRKGLPVLVTALAMLCARADNSGKVAYVGTPVCLKCHIDFARRWAALDHSKKMVDPALPRERSGCEACHGPGAEHVTGRRKTIVRWEHLELADRSKTCLQCHQGKVEAALWGDTLHSELMSCDHCHEVHKPVKSEHMLKAADGDACIECHQDLAKEVEAKTHHTLADGALSCDMCHTFHGSEHGRLLHAPQGELCAECHDQVPKTEAHQRPDYKLKHKAEAKGHEEQCYMCHEEQTFCKSCHQVPLPHKEDFVTEHGPTAAKIQDACLRCHEADFCRNCHDTVPVKPGGKKE